MTEFTDKQRKEIAENGYKDYTTGTGHNLMSTDDGTLVGTVVAAPDEKGSTGLQAYLVTSDPLGTPPDQVTHVSIIYRGSNSNFKSPDGQHDWFDNDIPEGLKIIGNDTNGGSFPSHDSELNPDRASISRIRALENQPFGTLHTKN